MTATYKSLTIKIQNLKSKVLQNTKSTSISLVNHIITSQTHEKYTSNKIKTKTKTLKTPQFYFGKKKKKKNPPSWLPRT